MPSPTFFLSWMAVYAIVAALLARRPGYYSRLVKSLQAAPGYNLNLEGLRGILALTVFFHHAVITYFYLGSGVWEMPPSRFYAHLGPSAVSLFFNITGFLFWSKLLRARKMDWAAYFTARARRLVPAYFVAASAVVGIAFFLTGPSLRERPLAVGVELFHWYTFGLIGGFPDINGLPETIFICASVFWTLRIEWLFYLALPLLEWFSRGSRTLALALLTAGGWALASWIEVHGRGILPARLSGWAHVAERGSHLALVGFLPGILVGYVAERYPRARAAFSHRLLGVVPVALLAAMTTFVDANTNAAALFLAAVFVLIALGCDVFGLLRSPGLLLLGAASYSVYVLHGIVLFVVSRSINAITPITSAPQILVWLGVGAVGCLILLWSLFMYRRVERPFMQKRDRLASPQASAA